MIAKRKPACEGGQVIKWQGAQERQGRLKKKGFIPFKLSR
jgi:hypothetical protein